jgi:hypothetical protein
MDVDELIFEGLKDLGILFWLKGNELCFKYPEGLAGDGRKQLYTFIKIHEEAIRRQLQNEH